MSFNADSLTRVATDAPRFFAYSTADDAGTLTGAGYFTAAALHGMDYGDVVTVTNTSTGDVYDVVISGIAASGGATGALKGASVVGDQTIGGSKTFSSAVKTGANVGTAGTGISAAEYGDGFNHTTALTLSGFNVGNSGDNASLALGALVYTFPAGVIAVNSASLAVGVTLADAVQTDTPEIGLGTVVGSGVQATLGAVGATSENILEGAATADVAGTVKLVSDIPTANVPLIIAAASAHTVYLNLADGWADLTAASALTATGSIVLNWTYLGA